MAGDGHCLFEHGDPGSGRSSEAGNGRVTTQGSLRKVAGDGHGLFESWQVGRDEQLGLPRRSKFDWRRTTAGWMLRNAASVISGMTLRLWVQEECKDGHVSAHAHLETYEQYCNKMSSTARYGGISPKHEAEE